MNLGLIGKNISYSRSKPYFENKFKEENIRGSSYDVFDLQDISELPDVIATKKLNGFNVTIPYKETIIPFLSQLSPEAKEIGAVNVVKVLEGGELKGYNSDAYAFSRSIIPYIEKWHEKALILGTGGAAKAVGYALKCLGIEYFFVSRNKNKAAKILSYDELLEVHVKMCPLIINCTPLGTHPAINTFPPIPYEFLGEKNLLFDLTYNPEETLFMQKGSEKGAVVANGGTMLVLQAEKSWTIWNEK